MKPALLIANLGNRNISVSGIHMDSTYLAKNGSSYRQKTQELWEELKSGQRPLDDFELQILPPAFQDTRFRVEKCCLFASDQSDPGVNKQDTLYAASLACELLTQRYGIGTTVRVCKKSAVNYDELIQYYTTQVHQLRQDHPGLHFVFVDAGGTPHQKTAMKLVLEFVLEPSEFSVLYSAYEKNESVLRDVPQLEFRKRLTMLQAEELIRHGLYDSAAILLQDFIRSRPNEKWLYVLNYLEELIEKGHAQAATLSGLSGKGAIPWVSILQFPTPLTELSIPFQLEKHKKACQARLSIAEFYLATGQISKFVLSVHQFAEEFYNAAGYIELGLMKSDADGKKLVKKKTKHGDWMNNALGKSPSLGHLKMRVEGQIETLRFGDAVLMALALDSPNAVIKHLASDLHKVQFDDLFRGKVKRDDGAERNDLTKLRNQYAHEGIGVSREDLELNLPGFIEAFQKWPPLLGLPDRNFFLAANDLLFERLWL